MTDLLDLEAKEKVQRIVLACQTLRRLGLGDKTPNQISKQIAMNIQKQRMASAWNTLEFIRLHPRIKVNLFGKRLTLKQHWDSNRDTNHRYAIRRYILRTWGG